MAGQQDNLENIAVESYARSAGYVMEEYLPILTSRRGKRTMRAMIDDATYAGILFVIGSIFRSIEWTVALPKGGEGDPQAEERREYLNQVLMSDIGMPDDPDSMTTFDDYVQSALDMLPWGYSLISPVLKRREDGLAGIGRFVQISAETVDRWRIEEPLGRVTGVYQESPYNFERILIDRPQFLHFKTRPNKGSPEGYSIFRPSYKSYFRRESLQTTESILAERGTGFPVVIADSKFKEDAIAGDKAAQALVKQLNNIPKNIRTNSQSGLTIFTDNYKDAQGLDTGKPRVNFQFAPPGSSNPVDFREAIRDYDMSIARSVMAQFMFNGSDAGNRALDESQTSTFLKAINGFAEIIAGVTNRQLVRQLWDANGWTDDELQPFVQPVGVDKENLAAMGTFISALTTAGADIFPNPEVRNYLLNLAGVPTESYDAVDSEEL